MKVKQGRILLDIGNKSRSLITNISENSLFSNKKKSFFNFNIDSKYDPRPISDKIYLSSCIREIIFFLEKNGFGINVSPKLLINSTSKNFFDILFFLFKKIDSNLILEGKIETYFHSIFKELKYPFSIPKSSRYSIGSPHAWPLLLVSLKWIVELLNYDYFLEKEKKINCLLESNKEELLWARMLAAYYNFSKNFNKNEHFYETIKALLKHQVKQEKVVKKKKKKKLKRKFKNFRLFFQVFILIKIFDKKEIHEKKLSHDFFGIQIFYFKNVVKNNLKKIMMLVTKKINFSKIIFFKKKKAKKKELSKILWKQKFNRNLLTAIFSKTKQIYTYFYSYTRNRNNIVLYNKLYLYVNLFLFKNKSSLVLNFLEESFFKNYLFFLYIFKFFIFFFEKSFYKLRIFFFYQKFMNQTLLKFSKIKFMKFQHQEDYFEQKFLEKKKFSLDNYRNNLKNFKKKNFFFKKKKENLISILSNKIYFKNIEVFVFFLVKINIKKIIFSQITIHKFTFFLDFDYVKKTNFLILNKIILKLI